MCFYGCYNNSVICGRQVLLLEVKYGTECNGYRNGYKLIILTMDIGSTESVEAAAKELETKLGHLDLIINNAVTVSPDCNKGFFEANLDYIANTVNVTSVGAMRVIKAFYHMLKKSDMTALIMNISSEAAEILRKMFESKRNFTGGAE